MPVLPLVGCYMRATLAFNGLNSVIVPLKRFFSHSAKCYFWEQLKLLLCQLYLICAGVKSSPNIKMCFKWKSCALVLIEIFLTDVGHSCFCNWSQSLRKIIFGFFPINFWFFLTAIWLPNGQLWAIVEETASITRCYSLRFTFSTRRSPGGSWLI